MNRVAGALIWRQAKEQLKRWPELIYLSIVAERLNLRRRDLQYLQIEQVYGR